MKPFTPGVARDAIARKGWWGAHRYLLARRATQITVLLAFATGPWWGLWLVKGNLNYSLTLGTVPLTDPLVLLQSVLAGHIPERNAVIGVAIVLTFYALVGGRVFCAWVCPVNIVTDAASAVHRRWGLRGGADLPRASRYGVLTLVLLMAFGTGSIVWELVNPVSLLPRGLLFGLGAGWLLILGIFLFDLLVAKRGWCGHLCPLGAFYSLLGRISPLRISARRRDQCNDCLDCYTVCPEQQVLRLPLKGAARGVGPAVVSGNCTRCARCIDVCAQDVFTWTISPVEKRS